jgi:NADP-dependent 3-hydroxy acid dehydrogenase YdfG
MTDSSLAGRHALVTGASRGIGRAVAVALAAAGARVTALARSQDQLDALARESGANPVVCDVTEERSVIQGLAPLLESGGSVPDIVVNAAGVFDLGLLAETPVEALDRNLAVNVRGSFLVIRSVLPPMLDRGSGLIVNVGSIAGRKAFPGNSVYSASKYGVRGLHEVLQEEIRGSGVRATLLEPAACDTPIWDAIDPDGRADLPDRSQMLTAQDVAEAVLFVTTRPPQVQIPLLLIERS